MQTSNSARQLASQGMGAAKYRDAKRPSRSSRPSQTPPDESIVNRCNRSTFFAEVPPMIRGLRCSLVFAAVFCAVFAVPGAQASAPLSQRVLVVYDPNVP